MTIAQTNPHSEYLALQKDIDSALLRVAGRGSYILGTEVKAFEKEFADYIGTDHCTGVASGTDAIELALRTLNIGGGDIVITTSMTAVATVAAIMRTGASPLLVDIEDGSFNIDPELLESTIAAVNSGRYKNLGTKVSAIVAVHLYGHPADIKTIYRIAKNNGCYLVEDCAQAHGAEFENRAVGCWGDIAAFSFYPTKNLGALGDGGALLTSNPKYCQRATSLRQYGWHQRHISSEVGINSRLDEIQAAVLRVKLLKLDEFNANRRGIAAKYNQLLENPAIQKPEEGSGCQHVYHQYVVRSLNRDGLASYLSEQGIQTAVHYPQAVHMQPAYSDLPVGESGLSRTEKITGEILSLPMWACLQHEHVEQVAAAVNNWTDRKP